MNDTTTKRCPKCGIEKTIYVGHVIPINIQRLSITARWYYLSKKYFRYKGDIKDGNY